jgi:hypothetical protein
MDSIIRISKKKLSYTGRAVPTSEVKMIRLPNNLWGIDSGEEERLIQTVIADVNLPTQKEKAEALAERLHISFDAARGKLRRREVDERAVTPATAGVVAHA